MGITDRFSGRRSIIALFLVVMVSFFIWWSPSWLFSPVGKVVSTLTRPVQQLFSWGAFEIRDVVSFVDSLSTIKSEHAAFGDENIKLRAEIAKLESLRRENETLRSLMQFGDTSKQNPVYAEVIGREGSGVATSITLNRGSAANIALGDPVVGEGGVLLGKILRVSPGTAEVRLLPHPESLVSAALSTTSEQGIIRGDHGLGMVFDLALEKENLKPGEAVVTSGLGDGIPAGILIGTIESVRPSIDRLFQQAIVVSPLRFDTLRFVAVLKP